MTTIRHNLGSFNVRNMLAQTEFAIPTDPDELRQEVVNAQALYEAAKREEIDADLSLVAIKARETEVWEDAYGRAVGSSQAAKKERAEADPAWLQYENDVRAGSARKKHAERDHSIAYQRLETLRTIYKGRAQ